MLVCVSLSLSWFHFIWSWWDSRTFPHKNRSAEMELIKQQQNRNQKPHAMFCWFRSLLSGSSTFAVFIILYCQLWSKEPKPLFVSEMHPCYAYWKWRGGKRINNKLIWKSVLIDVITWGIRVQSRNEAFTHTKQWGSLFPMMRIFFCFSNGNYVSMRCVCLSIWNINQRGQLSHEYLLSNHTCNGLLMTLTNEYRLETSFKYYLLDDDLCLHKNFTNIFHSGNEKFTCHGLK